MSYFQVFSYPLTRDEISYSLSPGHHPGLQSELDELCRLGLIFRDEEFYSLDNNPAQSEKRKQGNALAAQKMNAARRISRFIGKFPYVKAVMISGTLSKGVMTPEADIDFFIVTQPGRLWVSRTFLVLFKKLFLLNSHKFFCVNYFVDADHLEIEDKNLFTATEVAWLLPMVNAEVYTSFCEANNWARDSYPGFPFRDKSLIMEVKPFWLSRLTTWILSGKLGDRLDDYLLKMTFGRWKRKFGHLRSETFEVAMRSRKHVSKHHPGTYQEVVLDKFNHIYRSAIRADQPTS